MGKLPLEFRVTRSKNNKSGMAMPEQQAPATPFERVELQTCLFDPCLFVGF